MPTASGAGARRGGGHGKSSVSHALRRLSGSSGAALLELEGTSYDNTGARAPRVRAARAAEERARRAAGVSSEPPSAPARAQGARSAAQERAREAARRVHERHLASIRAAAQRGRARRVDADERRDARLQRAYVDGDDSALEEGDPSAYRRHAAAAAEARRGATSAEAAMAAGLQSALDLGDASLEARRRAHGESVERVRSALRNRELIFRDDPDAQLREALLVSEMDARRENGSGGRGFSQDFREMRAQAQGGADVGGEHGAADAQALEDMQLAMALSLSMTESGGAGGVVCPEPDLAAGSGPTQAQQSASAEAVAVGGDGGGFSLLGAVGALPREATVQGQAAVAEQAWPSLSPGGGPPAEHLARTDLRPSAWDGQMTYESLLQLEDVTVTASRTFVDALPTRRFSPGDGGAGAGADAEACPVCQVEFEAGEELTLLPCKHAFHSECIAEWLLNYSKVCPTCKARVE